MQQLGTPLIQSQSSVHVICRTRDLILTLVEHLSVHCTRLGLQRRQLLMLDSV